MGEYTEKELNYISRMCPMNDAMMQVMFEDNVELVEYILRLMTGIHDLTVLRMETQKNINGSLLYKSVRFDVYAVDSVGRKYNLEIQNKPSGAPGDRARYYMGMMDTHSVKKGEEEIILPQTYVIFIVTSTSYEIRKPLYHFIYKEIETNLPLDTESHIIYFDLSCNAKKELEDLQHDLQCVNPRDMHIDVMRRSAIWCKETDIGVRRMCAISREIYQDGVDAGKKEGIDIGKKEGIRETVIEYIKKGRLSIAEGAEDLNISPSELEEMIKGK